MSYLKRIVSELHLLRWLPMLLIGLAIFSFFYFQAYHFLNWHTVQTHQQAVTMWSREHYFLAVLAYVCIYTLIIAISVPGGVIFTLMAGVLFGTGWGVMWVMLSETLGAVLVFMAVRLSIADWLTKKTGAWVARLEHKFQENAFNYIVILRLIPIIPFSLVNVVAALLKVKLRVFTLATLVGVIPLSIIYVSLGHSLGAMFDMQQEINVQVFLQPMILYPLVGLIALATLPIIARHYRTVRTLR